MDEKRDQIHVELAAADTVDETNSPREIELLDGKTTYLIPRPSADPNGTYHPIFRDTHMLILLSRSSQPSLLAKMGYCAPCLDVLMHRSGYGHGNGPNLFDDSGVLPWTRAPRK